MPRSLSLPKSHVSRKTAFSLAGVLSLLLVTAPTASQAACSAAIAKDAVTTSAGIAKDSASAGLLIAQAFVELNDVLTRYANQLSNDDQNLAKSQQSLSDRLNAQITSTDLGETRTEMATEFVPSRVVCGMVARRQALDTTQAYYASYRTTLQNDSTKYSNNATGSGSERGTLQATTSVFSQRCTKYANPATIGTIPGVSCPGPTDTNFRDLDIQPWKAILDPIAFTTPARQQAAVDAIRMLTEVVPPDPVRGNVLLRQEGQNLHVMRMRDVTRMNLARGILEDIVAMRAVDPAATGAAAGKSRLARYIELVTGQDFNPATNSLSGQLPVILAAGEPENAAVQTASAALLTQQALLLNIVSIAQQMSAAMAVDNAISIEASRSGNAGVASRPINN